MSDLGDKRRQKAARKRANRVKRNKARAAARSRHIRKPHAAQRKMPKPLPRRPVSRPAAAELGEEATARLTAVHDRYNDLESRAQLSAVYEAIGEFDAKLVDLPTQLDTLRDQGYAHSGYLEGKLDKLAASWEDVGERLEAALKDHVERLDGEMDKVERQLNNLGNNESRLGQVERAVESLTKRVEAAESAVAGLYDDILAELHEVEYEIDRIDRLVTEIGESPHIRLNETEGPLRGVKTVWQRDGDDDGPEGMLFLTDQRFLFEQRQEVVTKKRFGIFKAESEMVQELLLDIPVHEIEAIDHKEEGGFLGMGKADILELVFSGSAPISRGRFHLKGQDSSEWAALIKRVQTGEIDDELSAEFIAEVAAAEATAVSFPAQCPHCYAAVPTPPRGVLTLTCEFCNGTIKPEG